MSHPTGNENSRHAALALAETSRLFEFWTCIAARAGASNVYGIQGFIQKILGRRRVPSEVYLRTRLHPVREALRLTSGKASIGKKFALCGIDVVYQELDRAVSRRVRDSENLSGVFGYEDGALEMFRAACDRGLRRIYELPMGYWRAWHEIMNDERLRNPEWAPTLQGAKDSGDKLRAKDAELGFAQCVFVASQFARRTLLEYAECNAPIYVFPYGVSVNLENPSKRSACGPLKIVYVGALTQRKGLSYLLEAVERMGRHVELLLIGAPPPHHCAPLNRALKKVRWIQGAAHTAVLDEMKQCDVLVLPSLFEGFGLVILEALAQGIAVVTTENTGGADIITNGRDGYVVPIRSSEAIVEKLETLVRFPKLLWSMRIEALSTARKNSWKAYRQRFGAMFGCVEERGFKSQV